MTVFIEAAAHKFTSLNRDVPSPDAAGSKADRDYMVSIHTCILVHIWKNNSTLLQLGHYTPPKAFTWTRFSLCSFWRKDNSTNYWWYCDDAISVSEESGCVLHNSMSFRESYYTNSKPSSLLSEASDPIRQTFTIRLWVLLKHKRPTFCMVPECPPATDRLLTLRLL